MVELVRAVRTPGDTCGSRAGHAAGEGIRGEPVSGYRRVTRASGPAAPDSAGLPLPASPTDARHRASFISVSFADRLVRARRWGCCGVLNTRRRGCLGKEMVMEC